MRTLKLTTKPIFLKKDNLILYENFVPRPDDLLSELRRTVPWQSANVKLFGKTIPMPRLVCWMADEGVSYKYSGTTHAITPWQPKIIRLKKRIEHLTHERFNSVLLNLYRDERDSMGWHSDDEASLGPKPVIASVSVGESRRMAFRARKEPRKTFELLLKSGSLLYMKSTILRDYHHCIRRESHICGPRINMTFRYIYS